jgi:hypothetical protein
MSCRPTGIQLEQVNTGNLFSVAADTVDIESAGGIGTNLTLRALRNIMMYAAELNAVITGNSHLIFDADLAISAQTGTVLQDQTGITLLAPALGFFGQSPGAAQPTVTGLKAGNAALGSLLTALASLGLIVDSSGT